MIPKFDLDYVVPEWKLEIAFFVKKVANEKEI